jgi:restriction endonuclease S subunit
MTAFPMVPLGEVLRLQRRWVKIDPLSTYEEIGVRCFGNGIFHKAPIDGSTLGNKRVLRIEPGDLVFNNVFAWEGAVAVASGAEAGKIGSHRFVTYTVDSTRCSADYLRWYFKSEPGLDILRRVSPGSAGRNRTMSLDQLPKQEIPLPPLQEQQRLVEFLDAMNTKIDEAKQLRDEADREHRWLWQGASKRLVNKLVDVPQRPLGDLVEIVGGGTPSKENPLFWGGDIPWVTPKDMKTREITGAIDKISKEGLEGSSARMLPEKAVLIVIRGMILIHTVPVAVLQVPATINQDMKALIPKDGLLPDFLSSVLWGLNQDLLRCVDKSSHDTRKLTTPKLQSFRIPIPSQDVQQFPEVEKRLKIRCICAEAFVNFRHDVSSLLVS